MRALLRPLATHSVFSPIEAIVSVFVLATLAYFHILTGIKHSSFFAPTFPSALRPAYARLSKGHWSNAIKAEGAIELQQIVFALDDKARRVNPALALNSSSLSTIANQLIEDVLSLSGKSYGEICHSPSNVSTCFTHLDDNTLTLSFAPSARDDWTSALKQAGKFQVGDYQFEVQSIKREEPISEMKSGKWVAYALRALVLRFWELTKASKFEFFEFFRS
ncbi:hypothetical protein QCA50_011808 [Cerrena zonata]|uniref:Uncharacterized protein n=1 Tax=Cerrena zonata TaxID=2478898 RepID=A0AAW0FV71_9APHY